MSAVTIAIGGILSAEAESGYQRAVAVGIVAGEVIQEASPPAHHHQQPATRVVISLVLAEMIGKLVDARRQESNLDLWRSSVSLVGTVFAQDHGLLVFGQRHVCVLLLACINRLLYQMRRPM
jgi:hypothetical protein